QSGARINISEGNCPERIITLAGPTNAIFKAFAMIIDKLEEVGLPPPPQGPLWASRGFFTPPSIILGAPPPLLGLLGGTGAQVQVAGDMLPNSTERAITIAGIPQSIIECVKQICVVMLEDRAPNSSPTLCHPPTSPCTPILGGGVAYTIQGQYAIPQPDVSFILQLLVSKSNSSPPFPFPNLSPFPFPLPLPPPLTPRQLIGCIIGRQGAKINEIRQMSGAQIKIANPVEGSTDRQVTITGSAASISLAQYLI
ncbi:Poly(rC)-binding protein 2, partial [Calypte anna]